MIGYDFEEGSIPALAGERAAIGSGLVGAWVYPRACGGTEREKKISETTGGLSSRLRGNVRNDPRLSSGHGSIPALAGERQENQPFPEE